MNVKDYRVQAMLKVLGLAVCVGIAYFAFTQLPFDAEKPGTRFLVRLLAFGSVIGAVALVINLLPAKVRAPLEKFGRFMGDVIGRVFLMLFYITVALPFGIGVALFGDPLKVKDKTLPVKWVERRTTPSTIESSYNQF